MSTLQLERASPGHAYRGRPPRAGTEGAGADAGNVAHAGHAVAAAAARARAQRAVDAAAAPAAAAACPAAVGDCRVERAHAPAHAAQL